MMQRRSSALRLCMLATTLALAACSQEGIVGSLKTNPPEASAQKQSTETTISAGGASTCVRSTVGDVRCWGENETGSLGIANQDPTESKKPLEPFKVGLVRALFSGEESHCAIRPDEKVYCWGTIAVAFEQGGVAGLSPMVAMPVITPWAIDGITGPIAKVAIGRHFMCTLGNEGDVRCFGLNQKGQLGLGTSQGQHIPTTVKGLDEPVVSLSASMGGLFVCAATQSGAVYCWGDNAKGQIGPGGPAAVLAPRLIEGLSGKALEVASGGAHACARLDSGKVACWGEGSDGQLGDGRSTASATPVEVDALTDVTAIATGNAHTCAVRSEGGVYCWGENTYGQAGAIPAGNRPWLANEASFGARTVSCGMAHTCVWGEGGRVKCWGSDARSQLGPKTATF